jgi:hypothetical protein
MLSTLRKRHTGTLLVAAAVLGFPASLAAQREEIAITGGWSVFANNKIGEGAIFLPTLDAVPADITIENGLRVGARVTFNQGRLFGHEINYAYQDSAFILPDEGVDTGIHNYYYNLLVYAAPRDAVVRPFVTGGIGFSDIYTDLKFGVNFGGGLKFKLSERFGLRLDVRDHVTSVPFDYPNAPTRLHNVEYSVGLSWLF